MVVCEGFWGEFSEKGFSLGEAVILVAEVGGFIL